MAFDLSLSGAEQAGVGADITATEEAEACPSFPHACPLRSRAIGRVLPPSGRDEAPVGQSDLKLCRARPDACEISIGDRAEFDRTVGAGICAQRLEHVDNLMKLKNYMADNGRPWGGFLV